MEEILIRAAQFILSLSILIILHELGHFIPAKLFKTRVEKFYLFFDPWFSLFKFKKGETEYGIGWLPLGGYVKISGMVDESMDKEQMAQPPQPHEFRSKPAWQRLIIMLGGVTVNLLLAMVLYAMTLFVWGETYLPNKNVKDGVWCVDPMAQEMGFKNGDKIISVNGKTIDKFNDVFIEMLYGGDVIIDRNGTQETITIPQNFIEKLIDNTNRTPLFMPRQPFLVGQAIDTLPAGKAGILPKDKITAINGTPIRYFDEFKDSLENKKNASVLLTIEREGALKEIEVDVTNEGTIGIQVAHYPVKDLEQMGVYEFEKETFGFFAAIPAGINKAIDKLDFYVRQFKMILNPDTGAYKGLGGFATMGSMFPSTWDWQIFWEMTAFLSVILAFMNILPIPALDGGHVMFLLYEMITRRKPNEKLMEKAQLVGMILLFGLLIFANGNDIIRIFFK
jgi:regulator of sigma E protease